MIAQKKFTIFPSFLWTKAVLTAHGLKAGLLCFEVCVGRFSYKVSKRYSFIFIVIQKCFINDFQCFVERFLIPFIRLLTRCFEDAILKTKEDNGISSTNQIWFLDS